ncbi:Iron (Metal) dependent repressor, DtxR family (fragment) [Candidatus Sulfopaludibacter sp. SbA3]
MDSPGDRRQRGLKPLDEANSREFLTVASVFERDRRLLEFLDGEGIRPGVTVEVLSAGDHLELRAADKLACIDRAIAAKIWVK